MNIFFVFLRKVTQMRIDIITVLPELLESPLNHSIVKRAREKGLVEINIINLRDFTNDKYKSADDYAFGGGAGMVMMIEPVYKAIEKLIQALDEASEEELPEVHLRLAYAYVLSGDNLDAARHLAGMGHERIAHHRRPRPGRCATHHPGSHRRAERGDRFDRLCALFGPELLLRPSIEIVGLGLRRQGHTQRMRGLAGARHRLLYLRRLWEIGSVLAHGLQEPRRQRRRLTLPRRWFDVEPDDPALSRRPTPRNEW